MSDEDRAARQPNPVPGRLLVGALLAAIGIWMLIRNDGDGLGLVIGLIALGGAIYQLVAAAVTAGQRDSH